MTSGPFDEVIISTLPLGVSRFNTEARMRPHTTAEAAAVVDAVHDWQDVYLRVLGHRLVFAGDEYYLLAGRPFPEAEVYEGFSMHEDGIGMARTFELEVGGHAEEVTGVRAGFFAWADASEGADDATVYEPYRGIRTAPGQVVLRPRRQAPVGILTGTGGFFYAKQGSMVAYQGDVDFNYQGSGGVAGPASSKRAGC